ncbi:AAA-domain-containing protein, partial [Rozella allomycis CSF55]
NIDLMSIIQEFEDYYVMRFDKPPKLVRHGAFLPTLPPIKTSKFQEPVKRGQNVLPDKENGKNLKLRSLPKEKPHDVEAFAIQFGYSPDSRSCFVFAKVDNFICLDRDIIFPDKLMNGDEIIGLKRQKERLMECVNIGNTKKDIFTGILSLPKSVLLYGPPGNGKTLLSHYVSKVKEVPVICTSSSTLISKWRGESEKMVKVLFSLAMHYSPCVIFLDEIDVFNSPINQMSSEVDSNRRVKTEMLIEMDKLLKQENLDVFLIAATNLPWDLDSAALRRFEQRIFVNNPSELEKLEIVEAFFASLDKKVVCVDPEVIEFLVHNTHDYSIHDIKLLIKETGKLFEP